MPIVRYEHGTVGVKNDGGTVQVQSTDLLVDGNLSVSGTVFIQNRDVAEYEDRVSFLEATLGVNSTSNINTCASSYRTRKYPKTATNWDYLSLPSAFYSEESSFPTSVGTDAVLAWNEVNQICVDKGMELCKSADLCPSNEPAPGLNIWGSQFLSWNDHWIAVGDEENEWYSFHNPKCTKHSIHAGSKPAWGTTTSNPNVMSRAGLCCSGLASQPSSLTHWIDFSTHYMESLYGLTSTLNVLTFADNMGNATSIKVNGNVKYTPNAQNGLGAIYIDASLAAVTFRSNTAGRNPEVFIAFNVVKQSGYISGNPHGVIFASYKPGAFGYAFGPYKTQENYFSVIDAAGVGLMSDTHASFNSWHIVNIYWGDEDGFVRFDGGEFSEFDGIKNFQAQKLEYVGIGGTPLSPNHHAENYVGEVLIFNEKLSESDRSMVTSYLMSKWDISSSGNTTCSESSVGESVSVISELKSLKPPKCMPPGGDKLQFDGMNWICVCNGAWTGPTCEQPPSPPPPAPPPQPTVPPPDQSKLSFAVEANFQGSSKVPPCPDEFPFWVSCIQPSGGWTSGWSGTRNDNCNWGSHFRNWDEIEASYNSYDSGDLMGCGGHQYKYPTSIKSYYESINILSVMKGQYDELVAGGLVPVATPV